MSLDHSPPIDLTDWGALLEALDGLRAPFPDLASLPRPDRFTRRQVRQAAAGNAWLSQANGTGAAWSLVP